jgi:hypothetical protein
MSYSSFGTWWHTVTHRKGSEGETGEWSGSQYSHTTLEHGVSSITNADAHTSAASSQLDSPADLRGLIRFSGRQNVVSARVPSGFKQAILNNSYRLCFLCISSQLTPALSIHIQYICINCLGSCNCCALFVEYVSVDADIHVVYIVMSSM